jgi:hypothetical protein
VIARSKESWRFEPVDLSGEVWKVVNKFDGYMISNLGRVKKVAGYPTPGCREFLMAIRDAQVQLNSRKYGCYYAPVARLMLEAFVGPPPSSKHVARHLDDDRSHNLLENLAWGTPKQNAEDASRNGRLSSQVGHIVTEKTKRKISNSVNKWHSKNPNFGKEHSKFVEQWWKDNPVVWITNGEVSKRVPVDKIPEGWKKGRIYSRSNHKKK